MILETRARFFGPTDSVQVAILVQENDYSSAAPKVKAGTVEILHSGTAMFTESFVGADRVLWFEGDTNYDQAEDRGQFYFFLHHPPIQQHMSARVTVVLADNSTATQVVPIDVQQETDTTDWQNPALAGRDPITFDKDPDFPYQVQE